jgi:hypothetical protein
MRLARRNNAHQQLKKEIKNMELDLSATERPPLGTYPGVFVDAIEGKVTIKKRTYPTLTLVLEIEKTNSYGLRFIIERRYILNTRGQRTLLRDAQEWLAPKGLSKEERKKFVPATVFVGKACMATVAYEPEDGRTVARAAAFMPAGDKKLTPSGKYVRAEAAKPAAATPTAPVQPPAQPPAAELGQPSSEAPATE